MPTNDTKEPVRIVSSLICSGLASTGGEDDANNEAIQCQCLSKDENENHSNKKLRLLCISSEEMQSKYQRGMCLL